jgi:hypothetical protein
VLGKLQEVWDWGCLHTSGWVTWWQGIEGLAALPCPT